MAAPAGTLTREQLHAIYEGALRGRAEAPSLETCANQAPLVWGLRNTRTKRVAGEILTDKARRASVALRNALPEAEDYWRTYCAKVGGEAAAREADRVERQFAALRHALDGCTRLLGPLPSPYTERWSDFVEILIDVYEEGMASTGGGQNFRLWVDAPLVIFCHGCLRALGWDVEQEALFKHLYRWGDRPV